VEDGGTRDVSTCRRENRPGLRHGHAVGLGLPAPQESRVDVQPRVHGVGIGGQSVNGTHGPGRVGEYGHVNRPHVRARKAELDLGGGDGRVVGRGDELARGVHCELGAHIGGVVHIRADQALAAAIHGPKHGHVQWLREVRRMSRESVHDDIALRQSEEDT